MRYPGVECFWAEATDVGLHSLRVMEGDDGCCPESPFRVHYAKRPLRGTHPLVLTEHGYRGDFEKPRSGWPAACEACGHRFTRAGSSRYADVSKLYRSDAKEGLFELVGPDGLNGGGPPGMLFDTSSWRPWLLERSPDGIVLTAVCPNGALWCVDAQASSGGYWTRTGDPRDPPTLFVTPSIVADDYHGFLQGGRFTDDLGS